MPKTYLDIHSKKLLRHVHWLNQWNESSFTPLYHRAARIGYLRPALREALGQWPELFAVQAQSVELIGYPDDFDTRNQALDEVIQTLVEQDVIAYYLGEPYAVTSPGEHDDLHAIIDRGSAAYFGIRAFGQHVNGFVRQGDDIKMWIARRAADRIRFPNKLDNFVAGGLPQNQSLADNLVKECFEEAGVPAATAQRAHATGAVSYCRATDAGLKPDTLYCYDLELPEDFFPQNTDGEVAEFMLLDMQQVIDIIQDSDEFKTNCTLVIINFAIRHGLINPDQAGYLELVRGC